MTPQLSVPRGYKLKFRALSIHPHIPSILHLQDKIIIIITPASTLGLLPAPGLPTLLL